MRVSAPATIKPCYFGVDTPTHEELIANKLERDGIRQFIDADSLEYLSIEGLYSFRRGRSDGFCDACFTGDYPVEVQRGSARQMKLFNALERRQDGPRRR